MNQHVSQLQKVPAYRPDIDGLRTVAVLAALPIRRHMASWQLRRRRCVLRISGYLITKILSKDIASGNRSWPLDFLIRRVRRIVPALLTVLAVSLVLGCFILMPSDYADLSLG